MIICWTTPDRGSAKIPRDKIPFEKYSCAETIDFANVGWSERVRCERRHNREGAALVKVPELIANPSLIDAGFLAGMAVACVSGLAAIGFLLRYVQTGTFLPFVIYRFALGALVLSIALYRYVA
jgi:hypothetical protein